MLAAETVALAHKALLSDRRALDYCMGRGLSYDILKEFQIGWVPPEETFNLWRGRIVFPIQDATGKYVAWQGRLVIQTEDGQPKYLHPKTEAGWTKSHCLFGLHQALRLMGPDKALYTWEGPIDACLAWASGRPSVACLGSSMSVHQALLCAYLSQVVVVATDNDAAGATAGISHITALSSLGVKSYRLLLSEKDLGDIVQQHGRSAAFRALQEAEDRCCPDLGKRLCKRPSGVGQEFGDSRGLRQ